MQDDITVNKELLPFNLRNAKREWRNTTANANVWYRLNKVDSSSKFIHTVNYTANYSGFYTKYTDTEIENDNYYQVFYLDTTLTNDSTHWRQINNSVRYHLTYQPLNLNFNVGIKNEYNQLYQYSGSNFQNNMLQAGTNILQKKYKGSFQAEYVLTGSNANDYLIELMNTLKFSDVRNNFSVNAHISYENRHPDYIYNQWFNNHYQWNNNFSTTQKLQTLVSASASKQQAEIGIIFQNISNAMYFNEQSVPTQTSKGIQNMHAFAKKNTLLFKHLGINAQYNFQHSSYQAITSLPNHTINGALYYQGNLFKRALQLQIGLQANYYSAFKGLAYMPATNIFYTQSHTMVGDYTFIDFFLNARIKPVRIFIKIDHLNQGFMGSRYQLTPTYWQNDRAFKFGINWLFFD